MRFKASVKNINTFIKLVWCLSNLGKVAWVRLDNDQVRFTIIPEQGTQVWAVLSIVGNPPQSPITDAIFTSYTIQSAAPSNTINLEVPLVPLHRALKSAQSAISASIRLTKKDNIPLLSLTIQTSTPLASSGRPNAGSLASFRPGPDGFTDDVEPQYPRNDAMSRETTVTQDIAVRVLPAASVEGIHEPRCREPDVHILLPPLLQLKSISERFTKLALHTHSTHSSTASTKLEISATMHGDLRIGLRTEGLSIESKWSGLNNPELDPEQVGGEEAVKEHPSTRMKEMEGDDGWAVVRVEGRDWGRVLGVGRLGGRVVACEYYVALRSCFGKRVGV
ncbi:hypothetical protein MMC14_006462 [Varicellaria rhodocarpa]|nr:hypothetical protein [Varicellaria rhodocarpa]